LHIVRCVGKSVDKALPDVLIEQQLGRRVHHFACPVIRR
jgi:hypothetical protein